MLTSYIALDVGRVRIGVAVANDVARIAAALPFVSNDESFKDRLQQLITEHDAAAVIVGWPRGLNGQETEQTQYVNQFVDELETWVKVPVHLQDEAGTSLKAEEELKRRGVAYEKGDIDSLSAVYILEDFLAEGVH
ncbi:MAG: putative Holliday junction resolvase [Candidatus Saccharibacteria bacterium]|nr:putative Holliday junction resolvase [Candidatus Saccharibacteria bacterium]